jgi:hypothetical protein
MIGQQDRDQQCSGQAGLAAGGGKSTAAGTNLMILSMLCRMIEGGGRGGRGGVRQPSRTARPGLTWFGPKPARPQWSHCYQPVGLWGLARQKCDSGVTAF